MSNTPHCYAIRRLNPFQGVMEVVEIPGARALSINGVNWQVEVEAERPDHTWGRDAPTASVRQFFRFGRWTSEQGLSRIPINPIMDISAMLAASERITAILETVCRTVPFPFTDKFECWLLDDQGLPLALLASTTDPRFVADIKTPAWTATPPFATGFVANSRAPEERPKQALQDSRNLIELLEQKVCDAARQQHRQAWYERRGDGDGVPLAGNMPPMPASAFPRLPWREHWTDPSDAALFQDYQTLLAPVLLSLTGLTDETRRRLEQAARQQAVQMAAQFRLYPSVLQPALLETARVEARLRRSAS